MKPAITTKSTASLRTVAKLSGVGHATVGRFLSGADIKLSVAQKLLQHVEKCPCCGKPTSK